MPGVAHGHSWAEEGLNEAGEDVRAPLTGAAVTDEMDYTYVVRTNLDMEFVNEIAVEIFKEWMAFALGAKSLDGKTLMHPTGRYAESLRIEKVGETAVAVIADPAVDIAAYLLEAGHGPVDLKTKAGFRQGRIFFSGGWAYPSKRFSATGGPDYVEVGATGWVIPAMPAYSPAKSFALMAAKLAQEY